MSFSVSGGASAVAGPPLLDCGFASFLKGNPSFFTNTTRSAINITVAKKPNTYRRRERGHEENNIWEKEVEEGGKKRRWHRRKGKGMKGNKVVEKVRRR